MNISFSVTDEQRDKYLNTYADYMKNSLKDGYVQYSQSKFFVEILNFWLENHKIEKEVVK